MPRRLIPNCTVVIKGHKGIQYESRKCHAKVGPDLRFDLHPKDGCIMRRTQERFLREHSFEHFSDGKITDVKTAHRTVENCLREMAKVKAFLEDDNSWWKILRSRSVDCCQQRIPHLHGILDGSSVTLILLEEEADDLPHHFVTSLVKKRSDTDFRTTFSRNSSFIRTKHMEQSIDHARKYKKEYEISHCNIDVKSTLVEVESFIKHDQSQQLKRGARDKKGVSSQSWTGRDRYYVPRILQRTPKEKVQYEERRINRPHVVMPRELCQCTQTMSEDILRPRQPFSSKNNGVKYIDFESNVDLTEYPSTSYD